VNYGDLDFRNRFIRCAKVRQATTKKIRFGTKILIKIMQSNIK